MKPTPLLTILTAALLLTGCTTTPNGTTAPPTPVASHNEAEPPSPDGGSDYTGPNLTGLTTDDFDVTVLTDELNYPWEVRQSEGTLIVTEIAGTIAMIDHQGRFDRYDVRTSDPVTHDGGSGLMGLELAGDFAESGTAYIYYTYTSG
ncbi:PQQ-dependent sugar dehydrogenase [Arthrobacter globiformis]|uniref:PQQ-dependent sugar dehydrogenase n=1 Tax=Arthrobacter globiformis TaxID=1665 RepID=UPI000B41ADFD|nr:PQQ-dependent sugar dehydrogenase [Arthrobacter globiformis]